MARKNLEAKPSPIRGPYEDLLDYVINEGDERSDRTGTGTWGVFGTQTRYNLLDGLFPLVTTKKVFHKAIFVELCWMMKGLTNLRYLHEHGITIWDEWADKNGDLGPVYGQQWRSWPGTVERMPLGMGQTMVRSKLDQLKRVIEELKINPFSRRLLVSAWNPEFLDKMALPPCHTMFQFYSDGEFLDCQLYQRSCDLFLGGPFNIASYAALTAVIGRLTDLTPRTFIHTIGDAHIYLNHLEQVREQLSRDHRPFPILQIADRGQTDPRDFEPSDFEVVGYDPHPAIKGEVAV